MQSSLSDGFELGCIIAHIDFSWHYNRNNWIQTKFKRTQLPHQGLNISQWHWASVLHCKSHLPICSKTTSLKPWQKKALFETHCQQTWHMLMLLHLENKYTNKWGLLRLYTNLILSDLLLRWWTITTHLPNAAKSLVLAGDSAHCLAVSSVQSFSRIIEI